MNRGARNVIVVGGGIAGLEEVTSPPDSA